MKSTFDRGRPLAAGAWDALVVAAATAAAVYVPLSILPGFVDPAQSGGVEWVLTALFTVDIGVQARRRRRPTRLGLAADVVAALPLIAFGPPALLAARLFKLVRVATAMRAFSRRHVGWSSRLRLAYFGYWLALTIHLVACGFVWLGGIPPGPDEPARYLDAVYWATTTLTTVGYGDVLPETAPQKLYAIVVMLMGVGLYAFLIGNIASLITNLDPLRVAHLEQRERLDAFVRYREIPPALRRRIQAYSDHVWEERLVLDEEEILSRLPPSLRQDVALHLRRDLVEGVPLFHGASDAFLRDVALQMHALIVLPGDVVVRAGQPGREMYVLSRGTVEVLGADGHAIRRLSDGDFFGEIALVHDAPRSATVRAVTVCDLYVIDREAYERVARDYPDVASSLEAAATDRLDE